MRYTLVIFSITFLFPFCNETSAILEREYYTNNSIWKEYYMNKDGKMDGLFKEFYENGKLKIVCNFKNGLKDGEQKEYFENGLVKAIGYYKMSKIDSISKWYFPNQSLKAEFFRLNGQLFGAQKYYFQSGGLESIFFMKNDSIQLFSFDLNTKGKIISNSKNFCYSIFSKNVASVSDTVNIVFYTIVPPNYRSEVEIIEKSKLLLNATRIKKELIEINNNKAVFYSKQFSIPGEYKIGVKVKLQDIDLDTIYNDSLFIPIKVIK